jgi:hypothetical protein
MPRRYARAIVFIVAGCVATLAIFFATGFFRNSPTDMVRNIEMRAHEKLVQLIMDGNELTSFATDGCSGNLSNAWRTISDRFPEFAKAHNISPPWEECCVVHDRTYHAAGGATEAQQSYALRLAADQAFRGCVFDTRLERASDLSAQYGMTEQQVRAAYSVIANAMFEAVRLGGIPCSGWGAS